MKLRKNNFFGKRDDRNKKLQDHILKVDCKLLELHLRFRGIPEKQGNLWEQMIKILAEFVNKPMDEIEGNCEEIYRVNSEYAQTKNIPRVIRLVSRKIKDIILEKQYREL